MASSILLRFPQEVFNLVLSNLSKHSLSQLRLASNDINNKVFPSFLHTCFEVPCVMLSRPSLQNLLQISKHSAFASAVKGLSISIGHLISDPSEQQERTRYLLEEIRNLTLFFPDDEPQQARGVFDRPAYDRMFQYQKFFIQSGLHTTFLSQALSALPHVDTVTICNSSKP
ncbi:hypothetical protein GQ53DRAFT_865719 [Thozetella sp. PMI_491]|nr:hypothetical protein GQ53DRAFT_865719 [Thozetella sp. PMI_491]